LPLPGRNEYFLPPRKTKNLKEPMTAFDVYCRRATQGKRRGGGTPSSSRSGLVGEGRRDRSVQSLIQV